MDDLHGKTAFITGGASGIGLGMARAFAASGMNIVIADIRPDELDAAAVRIGAPGRTLALQLDVTDRAAFAAAADAAEARFGPIHLLCNNAGVAVAGPVLQASWADWDWVLGVNLGGVINGVQVLAGRMVAHGQGGHIVNTASMSGLLPHPGTAGYTTSKAAVIGLSEVLASELGPRGIGVSAFCPGPVATDIARAGQTRPAHFAETGYAEADRRRQAEPDRAPFKDPLEIGFMVVRGVLENRLYILTHSEFRGGMQDRCDAIMASVPDVPGDPALIAAYPFLVSNPIHAAACRRLSQEPSA